jgi:hypothetical protein
VACPLYESLLEQNPLFKGNEIVKKETGQLYKTIICERVSVSEPQANASLFLPEKNHFIRKYKDFLSRTLLAGFMCL